MGEIHLITHTTTTSTPVTGHCIVFWQNKPKSAFREGSSANKPGLQTSSVFIDASPTDLTSLYHSLVDGVYKTITIVGIDILIPLGLATAAQILLFICLISDIKVQGQNNRIKITVIVNADDALSSGEHEILVKRLVMCSVDVTSMRALPSGRDKEFAGMVKRTRGGQYILLEPSERTLIESETLYRFGENLMI